MIDVQLNAAVQLMGVALIQESAAWFAALPPEQVRELDELSAMLRDYQPAFLRLDFHGRDVALLHPGGGGVAVLLAGDGFDELCSSILEGTAA